MKGAPEGFGKRRRRHKILRWQVYARPGQPIIHSGIGNTASPIRKTCGGLRYQSRVGRFLHQRRKAHAEGG